MNYYLSSLLLIGFSLIGLVLISCIDQKTTHNKETIEKQNIFTQKYNLFPIQLDTSSFHSYQSIKFKKQNASWYLERNHEGFDYIERYPKIINKVTHQGSKVVDLLFYNENGSEVVESYNLSKNNPYIKKYKDLIYEYPSFEKYSVYSFPKNQEIDKIVPDNYLTFYDGGITEFNGYTFIMYSLISVKSKMILAWETTAVIIDKNGNLIESVTEDNWIYGTYISDSEELFAYNYGRCPDNPFDKAKNGELRIYELKSKQLITKILPKDGYYIGGSAIDGEYGFIRIGHGELVKNENLIIVDFINLNSRTRYYKEFKYEEFRNAWQKYESYIDLIDHFHFTITTF